MRLGGLDIETTGIEQESGHRIIELALICYDEKGNKIDSYVQRFDPQRAIDPKAQAVHGISYGSLAGMPTFDSLSEELYKRLAECDSLIAHNMDFDGPFVTQELVRCGQKVPNVNYICTMKNSRWACPDGKLPKLGELCFALGIEYDESKAHGAEYDVEVMMACYFEGVKRGVFKLPEV